MSINYPRMLLTAPLGDGLIFISSESIIFFVGIRILEDRSRGHRSLAAASAALQQHASNRPRLAAAATWTPETIRPSQPRQVRPARFVGAEVRLQLRQVSRVFLDHSRILHIGVT
jgi:hypothetical protein